VIEDELRSLLTERAGEVTDDNAARVAQVHDRIGGIRRRRTVATTLALVLVVAAGLLLTRLPGKPDALPTGAPAGPYFGADGRATAPGFRGEQYFTFTGDATWSVLARNLPVVVVARCDRRGDLSLRNVSAPAVRRQLSCRVPAGDHYEGALPLTADEAQKLLAGSGANVSVRPSSGGDWTVAVLYPKYPDSIDRSSVRDVFSGFDHPRGGTFRQLIPSFDEARAFSITVVCVRDVQLEFRVSGRLLTTVTCDEDADVIAPGLLGVLITDRTATAAGLVPRQTVTLEVRSTGRQTGQWAVADIG
jgi:hypothetical protein